MASTPRRALVALTLALGLSSAAPAQTLRVVDPVLTVDGQRVGTHGRIDEHGVLVLDVDGARSYRVSDRPFAGATRVGEFADRQLVFALHGVSVRLTSREPIRPGGGSAPAYAALTSTATSLARGTAYVAPDRPTAYRGPSAPPARPPSAEEARLREQMARLSADRSRLIAERDAYRAAAPPARDRASAEREAALAERDRLLAERDRLALERDRQLAARVEDARRLAALRRDLDAARGGRLTGVEAEAEALRAQIASRDASLDVLRAESADRASRLAAVQADLDATRLALGQALAERDRLAAERDAAIRERDLALADLESRLRTGRADTGWQASGRGSDPLRQLTAERDALRAERDALALQLDALRAERDRLAGARTSVAPAPRFDAPPVAPSGRMPEVEAPPVAEPLPARDGSLVYLPGFDFGRLRNADAIRRRLDTVAYPGWAAAGRLEGDVLVLFQTDATGRVIRTAVPTPLGGGLDALAEDLVREMRFVPPVVQGMPTGLRSQVVVRFER